MAVSALPSAPSCRPSLLRARKFTFEELADCPIGRRLTWEEVIPILELSNVTHVEAVFRIDRGDDQERSAGSVEVSREAMLTRARNGDRWAKQKNELQTVNVSACHPGTLWIG